MPILNVKGDKLHFSDIGTGVPVVLVHGSCGGETQWKALSSGLKDNFRCISLDLFGSGLSEPWPIGREWTSKDDERAINAVLDT